MHWRDPRHPATFLALVLGAFLVARFLAVAVHESLGHGLFAIAFGGSFYGVYVSPVTGFALVHLPPTSPEALHAAVALAGIFVDLLGGVLAFRWYPRVRSFLGRFVLLTALEAFLVYSFAYLAVGAWAVPGGDPEQAAIVLRADYLRLGFSLVGGAWAILAGFAITRELLALIGPGDVRRDIAYLALFWFPPLPLAALPNAVLTALAPVALLAYVGLFAIVALAVGLAGRHILRTTESPPAMSAPIGRFAPVAVAALLVLPAWAFFGPTGDTATNLLFGDPPLAAEPSWADVQALNARVDLDAAGNVSLAFRMKGVASPESPLEQRIVASYEDRAYTPFWRNLAFLLASGMTNVTNWNTSDPWIDPGGTVWVGGTEFGHPRVVNVTLPNPAFQALLRQVVPNGTASIVTITVYDPFAAGRYTCEAGCFVDEVNVTWPALYALRDVRLHGGSPDELRGFDIASGRSYVRFRISAAEDAPAFYQVVLEG